MKEKIVLFGASKLGIIAHDYLVDKFEILYYCDNDKEKINKYFNNIKVISPSKLIEILRIGDIKVVISSHYHQEISKQLLQNEININKIMIFDVKIQKLETLKSNEEFIRNIEDIFIVNNTKFNSKIFNLYNIHLMPSAEHSYTFAEYIYRENKHKDNFIIIFGLLDKKTEDRIGKFEHVEVLDLNNSINFLKIYVYISSCKNIYIHSLEDITCDVLNRFYKLLEKKEMYWYIWGNDLYQNIEFDRFEEHTYNFIRKKDYYKNKKYLKQDNDKISIRKKVIKNIDFAVTQIYGDYSLLKNNYETNAKYIYSLYQNIDFKVLDEIFNKEDKTTKERYGYSKLILLSNSSIIENNVIDVFYKLKNLKLKDYGFILPTSYDDKEYGKDSLEEGQKLLNNSIIELDKFATFKDYCRIINNVDAVILNHKVQQAFGNVIIAIYLGKILYLNKSSSIYQMLKELGIIGLYSVDEICSNIGQQNLSNKDININRNKIKIIYNKAEQIF